MNNIFAIHLINTKKSHIFKLLECLLEFDNYKIALQCDLLGNADSSKNFESYALADASNDVIKKICKIYEENNIFLAFSGDGDFNKIIDMYLFGFYTREIFELLENIICDRRFVFFADYAYDDIKFHPVLFSSNFELLRMVETNSGVGKFELLSYEKLGERISRFY